MEIAASMRRRLRVAAARLARRVVTRVAACGERSGDRVGETATERPVAAVRQSAAWRATAVGGACEAAACCARRAAALRGGFQRPLVKLGVEAASRAGMAARGRQLVAERYEEPRQSASSPRAAVRRSIRQAQGALRSSPRRARARSRRAARGLVRSVGSRFVRRRRGDRPGGRRARARAASRRRPRATGAAVRQPRTCERLRVSARIRHRRTR
jgi:hypothetical protein